MPQALFVFMALSFARDEIIWLLRHADNMPKKSADDFIDKYVTLKIYFFRFIKYGYLHLEQTFENVSGLLCFL